MTPKRAGRAAPNKSRSLQQPGLKKAGASTGLTPHPVLKHLPSATAEERKLRRERVKLYSQREPIEVFGNVIIAGQEEYEALIAERVEPKITTLKSEPIPLVEYVLRRNIPRELNSVDRGCIAVLAYEEMAKQGAQDRMTLGTKLPEGWERGRWFEHAARLTGTKPGCVKTLARIRKEAPAVFEAIRTRRVTTLQDARALVDDIKYDHPDETGARGKNMNAPADRQEALRRYDACKRSEPLKTIIHRLRREKRIARLPPVPMNGKHFTIYSGRMEDEHVKIQDASVDFAFADIVYGERAPKMACEVARIAKRINVEGSPVAIMPGHAAIPAVLQAVLAEGLTFVAVGFVELSRTRQAMSSVRHADCDPVLWFAKGALERPIGNLRYRSGALEKQFHTWQKSFDAMTAIIHAAIGKGPGVVVDLSCGSATTGEAALKLECTFVGIDSDPKTAKIGQGRLMEVERTLAARQLGDIVRGNGEGGPAGPSHRR